MMIAPDDNPICTFCPAPATILTGDWELCDECACALTMPDPLCAECGGPLGGADVEAGEVTCLECGDGEG